jgi:hypothetical protein
MSSRGRPDCETVQHPSVRISRGGERIAGSRRTDPIFIGVSRRAPLGGGPRALEREGKDGENGLYPAGTASCNATWRSRTCLRASPRTRSGWPRVSSARRTSSPNRVVDQRQPYFLTSFISWPLSRRNMRCVTAPLASLTNSSLMFPPTKNIVSDMAGTGNFPAKAGGAF